MALERDDDRSYEPGHVECSRPLPAERSFRMRPIAIAPSVLILVLGTASLALAQTDCTKVVPPSPCGPTDQTRATNRVTPAVTKAAAAEITEGKVSPVSKRPRER